MTATVTIDVQAGTYNEVLTLNHQPGSSLVVIRGDTRTAAGQHVPTTGSITKSGSDCTITLTSTPPSDFTSADGGTARNNGLGYYAAWNGLTSAANTNANNAGNTTNYSPATSGTPGNFDGLTRWS